MKKKTIAMLVVALCVLVGGGIFWIIQGWNQTETVPLEPLSSSEQQRQDDEQTVLLPQETTESMQSTETSQPATIENTELVRAFSEKWITFSTIYERNQSVKEYLTDRCIQDNNIDFDPNVEYATTGTIDSISQDTDNPLRFIVIGTQDAKGYVNEFVLELTIEQATHKIDTIKVYDVRSGY